MQTYADRKQKSNAFVENGKYILFEHSTCKRGWHGSWLKTKMSEQCGKWKYESIISKS